MAALVDIQSALDAIDPATLNYTEWCNIGMALHAEGVSVDVWDRWSARDTRPGSYHAQGAESCQAKWHSFKNDSGGIGIGTLFKMAHDAGWKGSSQALSWDSPICVAVKPSDGSVSTIPITTPIVTSADVGEDMVPSDKPDCWQQEIINYLQAVFEPDEHVGLVIGDVFQDEEGKWKPKGQGIYTLTQAQLVSKFAKMPKTMGHALEDTKPQAGAYVRINPLDGKGVSDRNVTAYRHALIESDNMTPGKQLALIRAMRLPVDAVVYSGAKSVHAIVRVDAANESEYRERVSALYEFCEASGFTCDKQNRNPSRLSRLPGVQRGEKWQRLVPITWEHFNTWDTWQDWVAEEAAGLPPIESLADVTHLPPLAPQLIYGVLRDGQKGMLTGPSKAGKSFALIQLAVAVACGWQWLGHQCAQGRVLYINLEIQKPSFLARMNDVYTQMAKAHGINDAAVRDLRDIDVWNLRGHAAPLDKLVPLILRRAAEKGYRLIIIDPIYKVLTGDENSATDMSYFTNQFDVLCTELGCAIVYAHHHAKGKPGDKAAADRASGSGVFARDPDAMIDMSELDVPAEMRSELVYEIEGDDGEMHERHATAYRLEYTLREFESPLPREVLFKWPLHVETDAFSSVPTAGSAAAGAMRGHKTQQTKAQEAWQQKNNLIAEALASLEYHGTKPTQSAVWDCIENRFGSAVEALNWSKKKYREALRQTKADTAGKYCDYVSQADGTGAYVVVQKEGGIGRWEKPISTHSTNV